jgi:RNA polymerase sigma-70 factor (ECF subfamily)
MLGLFRRTKEARKQLELQRAKLYRVAYSWCRNPALADDLVQETLIKALQKSSQLRDPNAGQAWLFTILNNCFRDHFRRLRETDDIDNVTLISEDSPEDDNVRLETVQKVRNAIAGLSAGKRQVVTLVDLEGFSYIEVATILSIPVGTVMSRLCRARNELKSELLTEYKEATGNENMQASTDLGKARLRRIK